VGCTDPEAVNYCDTCTIDDGSCDYQTGQVHFVVEIAQSGISSLVSIANISCFTEGDEIGLYDASGQTNFNNCNSETGEILVGSGVYMGGQLDIVGIGSVDLCAFGGIQLPGYVDGHPIVFKAWDSETNNEYTLSSSQIDLMMGNGTWGQVLTQVSIDACSIVQQIDLNALMWNNISFYVEPLDDDITVVFEEVPVLVVKNDISQYYVPTIPVNSIGNMVPEKGYHVFLSGSEDQILEVTGALIDPSATPITINPLMWVNIAYLLNTPSSVADVMADIPVLEVKDGRGHYYVPGIGVNTIDPSGGMMPGSGYEVFLLGNDPAVLTYSDAGMSRVQYDPYAEAMLAASQSEHYNIIPTGISHSVIITNIDGEVAVGDEVAVYAKGVLAGATRIVDLHAPTVISAWAGYHEFGVDIDGYAVGDPIEIRVWSQRENRELRVSADLNGNTYGVTPLTTGSIIVLTDDVVPTEFELTQNYPNPFNPSTTIGFNLPVDATVSLAVYDLTGRKVQNLVDHSMVKAGYHSVVWDGKDLNGTAVSAGIYIYSLQGEGVSIARKMIMMK